MNRDALDLFERCDAGESFLNSVKVHVTKAIVDSNRNAFSFTGQLKDHDTPDMNLLLPTIVNVGIRVKI